MDIHQKISEILRRNIDCISREVLIIFAQEIASLIYKNLNKDISINFVKINEDIEEAIDIMLKNSNDSKK